MKRIYRCDKDAKLAGICSGIGEMVDIDPVIVRIAVVFLCAITGFFPLIIAYAVGWYLIPTRSELESKGDLPPKSRQGG